MQLQNVTHIATRIAGGLHRMLKVSVAETLSSGCPGFPQQLPYAAMCCVHAATDVSVTCLRATQDATTITVTGTVPPTAPCQDPVTDVGTATISSDPVPELSCTPTGNTVCDSEESVTVSFDCSASKNMAQLTASQFSVDGITSAGTVNTGSGCVSSGQSPLCS